MSGFLTEIARRKRWENDHLRDLIAGTPRIDPLEPWVPEAKVLIRARAFLKAGGAEGGRRPLEAVLIREGELTLIAEVKRASPSRGRIASWEDPEPLALEYLEGGAAAISVLTDLHAFDGRPAFLPRVRAVAKDLPILRKDFLKDEVDLAVSKALGADAVLLIVALLGPELPRLIRLCRAFDLSALVEVHDVRELELAMIGGATCVGLNNRDLGTLTVDLGVTEALAVVVPGAFPVVAESGVSDVASAFRMRKAGADAILVGEGLQRLSPQDERLRVAAEEERRRSGIALPSPVTLKTRAFAVPGPRGSRA